MVRISLTEIRQNFSFTTFPRLCFSWNRICYRRHS